MSWKKISKQMNIKTDHITTAIGQHVPACRVCEQLDPAAIRQLEDDYLCTLPELNNKKALQQKYGIPICDIISHMGDRKRHREQS